MKAKARKSDVVGGIGDMSPEVANKAKEIKEAEKANLPDNVIPFERNVITVIEPVIVSKEEYNMMESYLDEETDLFSQALNPRPRLKIID